MRGVSRRPGDAIEVSPRAFAWPRAVVATLRHSTLPWSERFNATPLAGLRNAGARDRLSLVGQYAAHVAFLQFAGIAGGGFAAEDWAVVRKRGADCRLVRIGARAAGDGDDASPLYDAQHFAEAVGAPALDSLRQSWTRAESIFSDVFRRLRSDASADLRWLQRSAAGEILSPGPDALATIWNRGGPHEITPDALESFRAFAALDEPSRLIVAGSEFPIQRYAALAALDPRLPGSPDEPAVVADRLLERLARDRAVVLVCGNLDEDSRRVLDILHGDREAVPSVHRRFVLSAKLAAQRSLEAMLATLADPHSWIERFITGDAFAGYLTDGVVPADESAFARAPEPRRSYIAALSLLGTSIPVALAREFLRQFLFEQALEDLVIDGVTSIAGERFQFASDAVRALCSSHVPAISRPAVCRVAATVADPLRAALLLIEAGDVRQGVEKLESLQWSSCEKIVRALDPLPRSVLTPALAAILANALADSGRYVDARDVATLLAESDRELVLARCERRTGDYAKALSRVEGLAAHNFEARILQAELLRLTDRLDDASAILDGIAPQTAEETIRVEYKRAVLALDRGQEPAALNGDHYYADRLATYRALLREEFEDAAECAARSFASARSAADRIDACLDRVFASFSSGRWSETRAIALEALALVDEAQGDRAAAGILFTLAFLEADDGRWSPAAQHISRLRSYYANDELRLAELDLLSAHLEFSRAQFADARRLATTLLERKHLMPQIREAAALIADEIDWIEKRDVPLRSTGSRNRELEERHRMMRARRGLPSAPPAGEFGAALLRWEASVRSDPPPASMRSDKLKLLRSALGCGRQAVAAAIAGELSMAMPELAPVRPAPDLEILRVAAAAEYPFRPGTFEPPWCYATRNRLGLWTQEGSRTFPAADLDRIAGALERDWLRCSDREVLFIDGSHGWPEASREAIAALFRTRAENHRLRRMVEQEEQAARSKSDAIEGVVGESGAMRAVFSLIDRIAQRDVPVCILGESGTGKELAGRAIHRSSSRRSKTFTAINCAALPENLIESELFGHVRGAFTGADRDRVGLIESSDGGTLFLDEIGEMPLAAQAKLLRFLQDGEFRRVGDTVNRHADVRIVSATNRKLETAVEEGRFREDLYYRVRGVEITLPPLRDRGDDVLLLARHFLSVERGRHHAGPHAFTQEVESLLSSYRWPGNVRELQNTVRAAHAVAADSREVDLDHLPERLRNVSPAKASAGSYQDAVAHFRRDLIEKSLAAAAGNQNRAAAMLKISRQALAYQIRELGILVGKTSPRPHL
jgi:DNA-binding NtrC family response regulator/tetratricopeptide (TPR) repeat protein